MTARIRVLQHDDRFLPVPTSPLSVRMLVDQGDSWRYDAATGTIFGRDVTSGGLSYSVTASEPRPSAALLADATDLPADNRVQQQYTALPELDQRILATVTDVVGGATTPYEKVRNIHAFLTDRGNGFRYSLSTAPGTSGNDLVDFLTLRRGYCEQYAGTMAVMVRAAGVPARVALGYTPGEVQDDGSRIITSDDAHAWVEVYFQSLGWVPFDPTPSRSTARWTCRGRPGPTPPRAPTAVRSPRHRPRRRPPPRPPARTAPPTGRRCSPRIGPPPARRGCRCWPGAGGLLVVLVAAATPAGIRARQRRRRLAAGTAGALWDELTATALDVGVRLQPSWTPRRAAQELAEVVGRRGDPGGRAADAITQLGRAEEAACYGPAGRDGAGPALVAALRTARSGLLGSASRDVRLRARLWPASVFAGAGARPAGRFRRFRRLPRPRRSPAV